MTAPTHIAFSALVYLYLCAVLRLPLVFRDAVLMAVASLLPDIDISTSGIGWRLRFLSSWVEKRFGHRTMTHSFLGWVGFSLMSCPLLFFGITTYGMVVVGFFSHMLLDLTNKEGCQVWFPNQKWGVFPVQEEHRIAVGSALEHVFLVGFIVFSLMLYPIASVGLDRTMHWLLADISGAAKDYHVFSPNYIVFAKLEGIYRKTNVKVKGTYRVLDALSKYALLIEIHEKPRIVGTDAEAHIVPRSIRVIKGEEITHYTQEIVMDGHTFGELAPLEKVDHRLFGTLRTLSRFDIREGVTHFNQVTGTGALLKLDYATFAEIAEMGLGEIPVLAGNLVLKTSLPPDSLFKQFSFIQAGTTVFPMEVPIAAKEDVLVKPGQHVQPGEILVAHSGKLGEITLTESEIEMKRKLRYQQSTQFVAHYQEQVRKIESFQGEIDRQKSKLQVYQKSLGFEKESEKLRNFLKQLEEKRQSLLTKKKELRAKDNAARLRYQQEIAELLAKKEKLETSVFTRAEFSTEIVNVEFKQGKCILYLRRLVADSQKGVQHD